jgi:hypothetical protein
MSRLIFYAVGVWRRRIIAYTVLSYRLVPLFIDKELAKLYLETGRRGLERGHPYAVHVFKREQRERKTKI